MFRQGDHVRVVNGIHKDEIGMVVEAISGIVTLVTDSETKEIKVFSKDLREVTDSTFGANVRSSASNGSHMFQLHDFVETLDKQHSGVITKIDKNRLTILRTDGQLAIVPTHQAYQGRYDHRKSIATDKNGVTVRGGDRVKESFQPVSFCNNCRNAREMF